jgi:hypothetical protein
MAARARDALRFTDRPSNLTEGSPMLERTWDGFNLKRWREGSERLWPTRHPETDQEVERLRETERHIASTTGWNSSTMVIGRLLERLRGERDDAQEG